ncbi:lysozyme [Hyphococcus flavus]|uniref:Lysozyme n=1 Tax=Hyphococcus flavus TaxID=1866326 RepID=A0AAE9ZG01_9PROT|nr:lysozyme [Hyphococcus flavus]WDI32057.1 lysozyme [Hyphococcus flavus]
MRMRLIFWIIIFALGALVGDRYGMPGIVRNAADGGFSYVESWFGRLGEPIPEAEESAAENETDVSPNQEEPDQSDGDATSSENEAQAPSGSLADNANLRINAEGLQIIKESEGLRLEAYNLGGQWLIGYGHSRTARAGMTITESEAEQLLREDVRDSEDAVKRMVEVPVNENQFSAMVSLAYNLGSGGFSRTTVLERINQGDYQGAADGFLNHNRAGGQVNEHLTHRREKERELFLKPA